MLGQAERIFELNSLIKNSGEAERNCKISVFTSGKGGTGKSFISANIAKVLSEENQKILLVDLDINFANLGTLFNVRSKSNIYNYLTYNQTLEDTIVEISPNLDLILGESGKLDHPEFTESKAKTLLLDLKRISKNYDQILIDTSSGLGNGILEIMINSDEVVLVTSPEPTSVMDAYVIFKMLKSNGADNSQSVIVNKVFDETDGENTFSNLEMAVKHFLKGDMIYLGGISFSAEVVQSIQNQKLLVQNSKNSEISQQIQQISQKFKIATIG